MTQMTQVENLKSQVQIRTATEADVPFIFNSWLKSYQASQRSVLPAIYFDGQHKRIEAILQRSTVLLAVNKADDTQIYGYLVFEMVQDVLVIHYAYVKNMYRQMGIFALLSQNLPAGLEGFYTHDTHTASKLIKGKSIKLVYNPYLA